jgi:small subunit ribosomal protein S20
MANIKSSIKRIKTNKTKQTQNKPVRSALNTEIKKFRANPTADELTVVFSALDSAAGDNIIHQNKANRLKAQLSKQATGKVTPKTTVVKKTVSKAKGSKGTTAKPPVKKKVTKK